MIKVEHMIIVDSDNGFLENQHSLKALIESNSNFKFSDSGTFKYKTATYNYEIELLDTPDSNGMTFQLSLTTKKVSSTFSTMLEDIKEVFKEYNQVAFITICDDVSAYYCKRLYPKIHVVENLMRKLITKFMVTKLGRNWHHENLPNTQDLRDSVFNKGDSPKNLSPDFLYQTDFITLKLILLNEYKMDSGKKDLDKKLQGILYDIASSDDNSITDEQKNFLKRCMRLSNWDRYFSELLDCNAEQISKDWDRLYEIRCSVAHNTELTKKTHDEGIELCQKLEEILTKAIDQLTEIVVPDDDVDDVSDNIKDNVDNEWKRHLLALNPSLLGIDNQYKFLLDNSFSNPAFAAFSNFNKSEIENFNKIVNDINSNPALNAFNKFNRSEIEKLNNTISSNPALDAFNNFNRSEIEKLNNIFNNVNNSTVNDLDDSEDKSEDDD